MVKFALRPLSLHHKLHVLTDEELKRPRNEIKFTGQNYLRKMHYLIYENVNLIFVKELYFIAAFNLIHMLHSTLLYSTLLSWSVLSFTLSHPTTHPLLLSLTTRQCDSTHLTRVGPHTAAWCSTTHCWWRSVRARFLQECSHRGNNYRGIQEKWSM